MRVIRIILIVVFALVFVVSAGLLAYGAINPPKVQEPENSDVGAAPELTLYESGAPSYDIATVASGSGDAAHKATDLMLKTAYNLINIDQFYFSARVDVTSGTSNAFSDYIYTRKGLDTFKKAQAYTGDVNTFVIRSYYGGQKLQERGFSNYDFDENAWSYSVSSPTVESKSNSKSSETPYYYYGTLDFPLDFGGEDRANDDDVSPRSEAIDYTVIDPSSVELTESRDGSYYTLSYKALTSKLNASDETKYRLSETTTSGSMSDIRFDEFKVTVEIWKESGVFRMLSYETKVHASLGDDSGDSTIKKTMKFSYDDENCSIARKLKGLTNSKGKTVYYNKLTAENKAKCDAEIAALDAKKAETEAANSDAAGDEE